jgi:hypothetical protein
MNPGPPFPMIRGYVVAFTIRKIFDEGEAVRFDVEIVLAEEWLPSPATTVRFTDVRDLRYGNAHEGISLGVCLWLSIVDVSAAGWEGIRFKVVNDEQDCTLSLYCQRVEILVPGETSHRD